MKKTTGRYLVSANHPTINTRLFWKPTKTKKEAEDIKRVVSKRYKGVKLIKL